MARKIYTNIPTKISIKLTPRLPNVVLHQKSFSYFLWRWTPWRFLYLHVSGWLSSRTLNNLRTITKSCENELKSIQTIKQLHMVFKTRSFQLKLVNIVKNMKYYTNKSNREKIIFYYLIFVSILTKR